MTPPTPSDPSPDPTLDSGTTPAADARDGRPLGAGTLRGLMSLAGPTGRFSMVATDQRPPLFRALARHGDRDPDEVGYDEMSAIKTLLTDVLAPAASAILIDPVWTHPHALSLVPGSTGLLSTLEGYDFELRDGERYSHPIEGWSVAKIRRAGAQGVKVLAWHRPDVSSAAQEHQDAFVRAVGEACRTHDIPFVFELLIYPFDGEDDTSAEWAAAKPRRVIDSVAHYADDAFGIDLLKLQFPAELMRTREYAGGAFDGVARDAVYDLAEVAAYLEELDAAAQVPWVLLSAGVGPREFAANLDLAVTAGASGFLAGRAVWMDALDPYPDLEAVRERLVRHSLPYLRQLAAIADRGIPWTAHRRYGGAPRVAGVGPDWSRRYPDAETARAADDDTGPLDAPSNASNLSS